MNNENKVSKLAVFDSRVVQKPALYGVQKGALSITESKSSAVSKSSNSLSWNIQVPSLNVFVGKKIKWKSSVVLRLDVNRSDWTNAGAAAKPFPANAADVENFITYGTDWAFNAFPLHHSVNSMSATINDAVCSTNVAETLTELLMLREADPNFKYNHTCPCYISKYGFYTEGAGSHNNSISGFYDQVENKPKNGAYFDWSYCNADGSPLAQGANPTLGTSNGAQAPMYNTQYTIYVRLNCSENLMISPFQFSNDKKNNCGLFGVNNIQVQMNLRDASQMVQYSANLPKANFDGAKSSMSCSFASNQPWLSADLLTDFLTPPLDMTLPKVSITEYVEYPTFITNFTTDGNATQTIITNTITLPQVPDYLLVYTKNTTLTTEQNDNHLPITRCSLTFDNRAGLLSTMSTESLYEMSYENGLKLDWNTWSGVAQAGGHISTIGGFLVLKMGKDVELGTGIAPGVNGNFTLSLQCDVHNRFAPAGSNMKLVVCAVNSGFFVSSGGSSSIHKAILNESEVMSAKVSAADTDGELERHIGSGFFDKLGSSLSKVGSAIAPVAQKVATDALTQAATRALTSGAGQSQAVSGGASRPAVSGGRRGKKSLVKLSKLFH